MSGVLMVILSVNSVWMVWHTYRLARLESLWRTGEVWLDRLEALEAAARTQQETHEDNI